MIVKENRDLEVFTFSYIKKMGGEWENLFSSKNQEYEEEKREINSTDKN